MEHQVIESKLISMLHEQFLVPNELLTEVNYNLPLTGEVFGFNGLLLTYVFFEVQRIFGIHLGSEAVIEYGFNSINKIICQVEKCLHK